MIKNCIIGAGIAGISLAKKLEDSIILEKSRGIGGRLAARRLGQHTLNHGPAELKFQNELISDPHSWVKNQAEGLNIQRSWEVSSLEMLSDGICIINNQGEKIISQRVYFAIPAPQVAFILQRSGFKADFLNSVKYRPAVQFMLLGDSNTGTEELESYFMKKKVSRFENNQVLTLFEAKERFVEEYLEMDKQDINNICLNRIRGTILESHVHKWRYSEVITPLSPQFQFLFSNQNIFLAGDYFGLNGVESSLQSVNKIL